MTSLPMSRYKRIRYINFTLSNGGVAEPGLRRLVEGQIGVFTDVTRVQRCRSRKIPSPPLIIWLKGGNYVNMANITISIPKELKARMDMFPEMNWSSFANEAIKQKAKELSWRKQMLRKLEEKSNVPHRS